MAATGTRCDEGRRRVTQQQVRDERRAAEGRRENRDGTPMCIDCGERPRPARRDGKPGTHHRCDPCARIYLGRRTLLRQLKTGPWLYLMQPVTVRCAECARAVPPGCAYFAFLPKTAPASAAPGPPRPRSRPAPRYDFERPVCWECVRDSGWLEQVRESAPAMPRLRSARVQKLSYDGATGVLIQIPLGMSALAGAGLELMRRWIEGVLGPQEVVEEVGHELLPDDPHGPPGDVPESALAATPNTVGEIAVTVFGRDNDEMLAAARWFAVWLTDCTAKVTVPAAWKKKLRDTVYEVADSRQAKRIVRERAA